MNIAATMAALDVWDLDRTAKAALVAVCCRAHQFGGQTVMTRARLAADLHCHPVTAWRALESLVAAGYVTVDKRPGRPSVITIDLAYLLRGCNTTPRVGATHHATQMQHIRSSKDKTKSARRPTTAKAPVDVQDNPAGSWEPDRPPNPWVLDPETNTALLPPRVRYALDPAAIAACTHCDDQGLLWEHDQPVARCTHRRKVTDLTIDAVLGAAQTGDST
jgi:hypothetical protein